MSRSVAKKVRVYVKDILDEAFEQDLIPKNPARKLDMPRTRKPCERNLSIEEVAAARGLTGRDHLIVRLFVLCALRPGNSSRFRRECVEDGRLRIKEAITRGEIQDTKTEESNGYVALPPSLRVELTSLDARRTEDPARLHFRSRNGTPLDAHNYLTSFSSRPPRARDSQPTFSRCGGRSRPASRVGTVKDAQTQFRHADAQTTMNIYQKSIPASVSSAVEHLKGRYQQASRRTAR